MATASSIENELNTNRFSSINTKYVLGALLVLGFAFRIGTALLLPNVHYPDEFFQTLEPAHRLAFGHGIITWEFRLGTRSWVLPSVLAAVMKATAWLGGGSTGYLAAVKAVLCLFSLTTIVAAYKMGRQVYGERVGYLCAFLCAFWYELIYFAPRALSEVVAAHFLVLGIYLAAFSPDEKRWRMFAAGMFCAFALMFRVQLAPAIAVIVIYSCRKEWRSKWLPMVAGMMPPILLFGIVDWFTWSYPFQSTYLNFTVNLLQHKAAQFGTQPFNFYIRKWLNFLTAMLLFSIVGAVAARRARVLTYTVLAILIPHSLLAHKELRFIYPALPLMLILAGLGIWESAKWLSLKTRWKSQWATALTLLFVVGGVTTAMNARKVNWHYNTGALVAMQQLSQTPGACGVALHGVDWGVTGGYSYLHRDVPIFVTTVEHPYTPISPEAAQTIGRWMNFDAVAGGFNYVIAADPVPLWHREYKPVECWGDTCLYQRPGACRKIPNYSTNELLRLMQK